jgi:hypothetical protein
MLYPEYHEFSLINSSSKGRPGLMWSSGGRAHGALGWPWTLNAVAGHPIKITWWYIYILYIHMGYWNMPYIYINILYIYIHIYIHMIYMIYIYQSLYVSISTAWDHQIHRIHHRGSQIWTKTPGVRSWGGTTWRQKVSACRSPWL